MKHNDDKQKVKALEDTDQQGLKNELDALIDQNESISGAYTKIINEMEKRINSKINTNAKDN